MGWYINYEIEFEDPVSWDDEEIRMALRDINCHFLYLRDYTDSIVIFSLYMKHEIKDLLNILARFFATRLKYRLYGTDKWTIHKEKN
jgi:hypothetical protein